MSRFLAKDDYSGTTHDTATFLHLLNYAKFNAWQFISAFLLLALSAGFAILSARLLGTLVEEGLLGKQPALAQRLGFYVVVLEFLALMGMWFGRRVLVDAAAKTILIIRKELFVHIHRLPIRYYDQHPLGRTVTRITHDVEGLDEFFTGSLGRLISSSFMAITSVLAMVITDFFLGIALVLSMTPAVILTIAIRKKVRLVNRDMSTKSSAINARLSEYLNGLEVIRSFGLEDWSQSKMDHLISSHLTCLYSANKLYSWSRPLISVLCNLPLLALLALGGYKTLTGSLSIGLMIAFIRYCERFSRPIVSLAREAHVIQQAFTYAERVAQFLKSATEDNVLGPNGSQTMENIKGHIAFEHVNMAYQTDKPVLHDVSFDIPPGTVVGLVGATGSGKTTTVALISRLYHYNSGQIRIDDIPIEAFCRSALRSKIGFVSQDVVIFSGSIRANLTMGEPIDESVLQNACHESGLLKALNNAQLNLDSTLTDQGANISAGERQLIALTRVLISDPTILILDEATSNIDPDFERIIHAAVAKIMQQRTCLIVAHRLETLKNAQHLLVFDLGRLVENGTHAELLEKKGRYFQLIQSNFSLGVPS